MLASSRRRTRRANLFPIEGCNVDRVRPLILRSAERGFRV
jgi:hypothetical protein